MTFFDHHKSVDEMLDRLGYAPNGHPGQRGVVPLHHAA